MSLAREVYETSANRPEGPEDHANVPTQDEISTQVNDLESSLTQLQASQKTLVALERIQTTLVGFAGTPMTQRTAQFFHDAYAQATANMEGMGVTLPSLECYAYHDEPTMRAISQESIGSTIRRAVEIVMRAIARLGHILSELFDKISPNLRMQQLIHYRVTLLARQVAGRFPESGDIPLGWRAGLVSTELKPVETGGDVITNLNEFISQFKVITGPYMTGMTTLKRYYLNMLTDLPETDDGLEERLQGLASQMVVYGPANYASKFRSQKKISDPRYPSDRAVSAAPLPGQRSLIVVSADGEELSKQLQQHIDLTRLNPSITKDYSKSTMKTMLPTEINEVLKLCGTLIGLLKQALVDGGRLNVSDMAKSVKRASDELESSYAGRQGPMAELVSAGATISNWIATPYMPLISLATSVVSAAMKLTAQNIRSYGVDEKSS